MNTPTPTEAHLDLVESVRYSNDRSAALQIADSEARAVAAAVTALTCTHHNDQQRAECPVCLVTHLTAERDLLCRCLRGIVDEQNGAPLELRRQQWQAAMDEALAALEATEGAK